MGIFLLAIMFLPIAIAIKLDDGGSVIYSQVRCGLNGKEFRILKFRTMVENAHNIRNLEENEFGSQKMFKNANDSRITKVGKFLRKTSLDEFPQFINVLIGDMSLVGTRPPTPCEVKHYSDYERLRLSVKPGITGVWQTSGRSDITCFKEVVSLDLSYLEDWTIYKDLKIILKTFVTLNKGAS